MDFYGEYSSKVDKKTIYVVRWSDWLFCNTLGIAEDINLKFSGSFSKERDK